MTAKVTNRQLIKGICEMWGKIPHDWCVETQRIYARTWAIVEMARLGLVTPTKNCRHYLIDFYWLVEQKYNEVRNS